MKARQLAKDIESTPANKTTEKDRQHDCPALPSR